MSPTLNEGDYILIKKPRSVRVGFIYVLNHERFGRIVKRLIYKSNKGLEFAGDNPASTPSNKLGPIQPHQIIGRALIAITPTGLRKLSG